MLELDIQRFADYGDVGDSNETTSAPKNIIKLKRGMAADVGHLTLEPGELAAVLDSNKLKMGDHLGTVRDVEAVSADSAKRTVGNLTIQQHGNTIDTFNGSENKTINLTPESGLATFEIRDGNLYVQGNNISDIDNYYINEYGHLMLVLNEVEKDLGKVVGEDGQGSDPNAIKGDGSIVKIVEMTLEEYQNLENIEEDTEYHIIDDTTLVTTQIVDDLNVNESGMALSAKQGKVLNEKVETLNTKLNSNVVYEYTIPQNTTTVVINGLDLAGDGGLYTVHYTMKGTEANPTSLFLRVNDFTQGFHCIYSRSYGYITDMNYADAINPQSWYIGNSNAWQCGELTTASYNYGIVHIMKSPDGIKMNSNFSYITQSCQYAGVYDCNLYSTTANLTKLTFWPSSGYLAAGSRIVILKHIY